MEYMFKTKKANVFWYYQHQIFTFNFSEHKMKYLSGSRELIVSTYHIVLNCMTEVKHTWVGFLTVPSNEITVNFRSKSKRYNHRHHICMSWINVVYIKGICYYQNTASIPGNVLFPRIQFLTQCTLVTTEMKEAPHIFSVPIVGWPYSLQGLQAHAFKSNICIDKGRLQQ